MNALDRDGTFLATIGTHVVAPKGKNNNVAFQAVFHVTDELLPDGTFADIRVESREIVGDFYITKDNGLVANENAIKQCKDALGWDGIDPFWMEDSLPPDLVVKIVVEWDVPEPGSKYKSKLQVKWLNNKDFEGSAGMSAPLDANARRAIMATLGPKLKAINGGRPAAKPALPAKPPTSTPATQSPPATPATPATTSPAAPAAPRGRGRPPATRPAMPVAAPTSTLEAAYEAFCKDIPEDVSGEYINEQWAKILTEMFPGKAGDSDITPAEWHKVLTEAPSKYVPF